VSTLLLLRHGQSAWNLEARFTGWTEVPLTERGVAEATRAGELLAEMPIGIVHTSLLGRSIRTAEITLATAERSWVPVRRHWRLNERHYGALQGHTHAEIEERHGAEAVRAWRRSYGVRPPALERDDPRHPIHDPRYADVPAEALPSGECLADVVARLLPYWYDVMVPDLRRYGCVLVVAHGNSLRALVKHLEAIGDDEIPGLEIPTGVPIRYELDRDAAVASKQVLDA
jgi:2,3-bisphosphoglycerate-dependent phosphoglycerate mutase